MVYFLCKRAFDKLIYPLKATIKKQSAKLYLFLQ